MPPVKMAGRLLSLLKGNQTILNPGLLSQAAVYGANVIGLSYYLKHSLLLRKFKDIHERYGEFGPDEPVDDLNDMLSEILSKDLKDEASENTPIALFLTSGLEPTHLGTIGTVTGGFVGVPIFYEFKNKEDARENVLVKHVNFNFDESNQENVLSDCFLLSDKAKKYGIAREILFINTYQVYINALLPLAVSLSVALLYKEMHTSYQILKKPLYMRCLIYTAVILVGLNFWKYLYKRVLRYHESEVEEKITQLGEDYIKGGIEYCTKALKRHSLPVELKNEKHKIFKAIDDFFVGLMPSGVPLKVRLEYLEKHLERNSKILKQYSCLFLILYLFISKFPL